MYDEEGNWIGDDGNNNGGSTVTDNGDGTVTDSNGDVWDVFGNWLGNVNAGGNGGNGGSGGDGSEFPFPQNWIVNEDLTVTDPDTGNMYDALGNYVGNTADAGLGGGNVVLDPDEYGDVRTVNGKWIGNIYGLGEFGLGGTPRTGGTPGGAYSSGGFGGGSGGGSGQGGRSSDQQLMQQLQQMLAQAKAQNKPASQQLALQNSLRNLQARTSSSSNGGAIFIAAAALVGLMALSRSR